jgi:cyclohexanone monooxygenase
MRMADVPAVMEQPVPNSTPVLDALVIGAGFNGVYQLHRLREEGFAVQLFEAGTELGGIWHSNRYPGARVDSHVPNYEYSLESVWRDWSWSERFPSQAELRAYFRHVDAVLDLSRDVRFGARVTHADWDDAQRLWCVHTADGRTTWSRFVIPCLGFASKPYVPALPGLSQFAGPCHHTALWPAHGLDLAGRRVGVLGTGASGVQVIQALAPVVQSLTVFQRTPMLALPMQQQHYDAAASAALKAQYPAMLARRAISATTYHDVQADPRSALAVTDAEREARFEWAWQQGGFHFWAGTFGDVLANPAANRLAYDFWRAKTRARIHDPVLAQRLAPDEPPHPFGAKRPSLETDYYEQFNRPNVALVDLRAEPILEITRDGVRTRTTQHALDALVLATGFDASTGGLTAIDWRGVGGVGLDALWHDGVVTHLGMAMPGFPNLLMLYGPQSPTAFCNGPTCAELQGEWLVDCLRHLRAHGHQRIEPTAAAAQAWGAHMREEFSASLLHQADSWYVGANVPGKARELLYYANAQKYLREIRAAAQADYAGFRIG